LDPTTLLVPLILVVAVLAVSLGIRIEPLATRASGRCASCAARPPMAT
jgi:hypothetical protein